MLADMAQTDAQRRDYLRSFEISPIHFVIFDRGQRRAPNPNLCPYQRGRLIAVGHTWQSSDDTFTLGAPMATFNFMLGLRGLQQPRLVIENSQPRFAVRFQFYPARDTVYPDDPAKQETPVAFNSQGQP